MAGRPSDFTQETADTICRRIAEGESLRRICADDGMPSKSIVFEWLMSKHDFSDQYARARTQQAETYADDIVDIADNEPDSQKARVRIDARKWHSSKLAPKKYGEKVTQEHSGPDGGPIKTEVTRVEMVVIDPRAEN